MPKHTPGRWHITDNRTPGQFGTEEKVRDRHNSVICTLHVNSKANGPLIAAAPDLLEALKAILDETGGMGGPFTAARAAIAKATGG